MAKSMKKQAARLAAVLVTAAALIAADGPRNVKPGFNLFSKDQDIQLGKEAEAEYLKQLPIVENKDLVDYIKRVGDKITSQPEAQGYPYSWHVVQDDSINAFALPGGPMFVNTGLITQADNEAQLAGVLGHEISHIILRHGTNQASKANFMQLAAALGGAMLGDRGMVGSLAQLGINIGLSGVLLKYSRGAERDADILGMRLMSAAGYNPIEMARFFEKLSAGGNGKANKVQQWFSSHPQPEDRTKTLENEIRFLSPRQYTVSGTGNLGKAQQLVAGLPKIQPKNPQGQQAQAAQPGSVDMPRFEHSGRLTQVRGQAFTMSYPDNWKVQQDQSSGTITVVPPGGSAASSIGYGAIATTGQVRQGDTLQTATQAFIQGLTQSNPGLKVTGQPQQITVSGRSGLVTELEGDSVFKNQRERVTAITAAHPRNMLFSVVFIYPSGEATQARQIARQVVQSIRFE